MKFKLWYRESDKTNITHVTTQLSCSVVRKNVKIGLVKPYKDLGLVLVSDNASSHKDVAKPRNLCLEF